MSESLKTTTLCDRITTTLVDSVQTLCDHLTSKQGRKFLDENSKFFDLTDKLVDTVSKSVKEITGLYKTQIIETNLSPPELKTLEKSHKGELDAFYEANLGQDEIS